MDRSISLTCGWVQNCGAQCYLGIVQSFNCEFIHDVWGQRVDGAHHRVWTKCDIRNVVVWWGWGGDCDFVRAGSGDPGPSEYHGLGCCWKHGYFDASWWERWQKWWSLKHLFNQPWYMDCFVHKYNINIVWCPPHSHVWQWYKHLQWIYDKQEHTCGDCSLKIKMRQYY